MADYGPGESITIPVGGATGTYTVDWETEPRPRMSQGIRPTHIQLPETT